ncbi:MAG: T9SS type A sorting domain-containing protein, partial [Bacteroidota bacterium]
QRRNVKSGATISTKSNAGAVSVPHWIRIVRSGNEVSGYHSPDGNNWILADVDFIPMSTDIYVGLAVTSHDDTQLASATFQDVSFGGSGFSFPVEFLDFNATPDAENSRVELNWATASEENNSHFVVERSRDGAIFEPLGQVAGVGNSTFVNEYQYFDESPVEGKAIYRLKQIDLGGAFSFSEQVEVTFESRKIGQMIAYPNPASRGMQVSVEFTLPTAYSANVQLVAIDGRMVWNQLQILEGTGVNRIDVPTERLIPGMYLLSIRNPADAEQVISKRIVISQ